MKSPNLPLVSVLVPVYQAEKYIERCARSLFEQTYDNLEYVFVNDCTTDGSISILERTIKDYPECSSKVHVIHHHRNRGASAARNTGIEAARGEYFFFMDADDELTTDCIEKLVEPLTEQQYDIVIGNTLTIGNDRLGSQLRLKLSDGEVLRGSEIMDTYRKKWNMTPCNKLCRTAFIRQERLLFKEGLYYEDELWCFQVACVAKTLRAVNQLTYKYMIRENSATTSIQGKKRKQDALRIIVGEMQIFLKDRNIFSASAYHLIQYFVRRILKPLYNNRSLFVKEYCQLRKTTHFPLIYRIKVTGFHPRAQIRNLYYAIPPRIAAEIIYLRNSNYSHKSQ